MFQIFLSVNRLKFYLFIIREENRKRSKCYYNSSVVVAMCIWYKERKGRGVNILSKAWRHFERPKDNFKVNVFFLFFSEFKRDNSRPDQPDINLAVSQSSDSRHILLHHCIIYSLGMFWHLFRTSTQCKLKGGVYKWRPTKSCFLSKQDLTLNIIF